MTLNIFSVFSGVIEENFFDSLHFYHDFVHLNIWPNFVSPMCVQIYVKSDSDPHIRQSADILNLKPKNSKLELRRNCFSNRVVSNLPKM